LSELYPGQTKNADVLVMFLDCVVLVGEGLMNDPDLERPRLEDPNFWMDYPRIRKYLFNNDLMSDPEKYDHADIPLAILTDSYVRLLQLFV